MNENKRISDWEEDFTELKVRVEKLEKFKRYVIGFTITIITATITYLLLNIR